MEKQMVCPNCGKVLTNNSMIEEAARGEGSDTQSMNCECGERITYWNITAQMRDQKTFGSRFRNWLQTLMHSRN